MRIYERRKPLLFRPKLTLKGKFFPIGLALIALLSMASANAFGGNSSDETAVRTLVMGFPAAWNRHDIERLGGLFMEDADLINVVGMHWRGRNNIVTALRAFHRAMFAKEQIHFGDVTIRLITPDVAVVVAVQTSSGEIAWRDGRKQTVDPLNSQLDTFVVVKRAGAWKIAHNENTIVDQKAQPDNPVNGGWNGEIGK
jgi:uncharacterized protein (TIGR02246 family)